MEVELKLLLDGQGAKAVLHHPLLKRLALDKPYVRQQSDVYFDTPDLQLRHAEAGLRVRRVGEQSIQTLKAGGGVSAALHSRHEWESPVDDAAPDLAALRRMVGGDTDLGRLLRAIERDAELLPLFTVRTARTVWALRLEHGDQVEFVLDQGCIDYDGRSEPICEIELELVTGEPAHLYGLALALLQDIPLRIGPLSKAARGYALYTGQAAAAVGATVPALSKHMTVEQAFQAIAGSCLAQIQANEAGIGGNDGVESIHQMRVGLRRLRSALDLFGDAVRLPDELERELEWLSEQLGGARDWEVLAGVTLPRFEGAPPLQTEIGGIAPAVIAKADEMHLQVVAAVASSRYTRLVLSLGRWLLDRGWRAGTTMPALGILDKRLPKFARDQLRHGQRRLRKRGRRLARAGATQRHRARIAAKKLRYATEFFQLLYPARQMRPYVAALARLQDELGRLNDTAVADRLLQQLQQAQPALAQAAAFARGYLAAALPSDAKELRKCWKKFVRTDPPC